MMKLRLLPAERMDTDFPWMLWAIGWLAILKALLWLAYEPVMPEGSGAEAMTALQEKVYRIIQQQLAHAHRN